MQHFRNQQNCLIIIMLMIFGYFWPSNSCAMSSLPTSTQSRTNISGQNIQDDPATTTATAPPPAPTTSAATSVCPLASELVKNDLFWYSKDNRWRSYTQSFSSSIKNFIGAQWEGVKLGKIFCLYLGNEEFAFPIALEQLHSQIVIEPTGANWSSEINGGFRACKSTNVVDCSFYYQLPPDLSHIYEEIQYTGGTRDNE